MGQRGHRCPYRRLVADGGASGEAAGKGHSTFSVLVGAQPVPSIECSLSKLKQTQKAQRSARSRPQSRELLGVTSVGTEVHVSRGPSRLCGSAVSCVATEGLPCLTPVRILLSNHECYFYVLYTQQGKSMLRSEHTERICQFNIQKRTVTTTAELPVCVSAGPNTPPVPQRGRGPMLQRRNQGTGRHAPPNGLWTHTHVSTQHRTSTAV